MAAPASLPHLLRLCPVHTAEVNIHFRRRAGRTPSFLYIHAPERVWRGRACYRDTGADQAVS